MITLVLGGIRSGKSAVAEQLAAAHPGPVTYVATMVAGDDPGLAARIAAHRARRPQDWSTVDAGPDLAATLATLSGTVLVDSLGPWLAARAGMAVDAVALALAISRRRDDTVVVSDEVGLSVHPLSASGLRFADALGALNQAVASVADRALLVVAGRVVPLAPPGDI